MQTLDNKKSNILDTVRKRVIYFADIKGGGRAVFMKRTGLKKGIFDPKDIERAMGSDKISNILDSYPDVNAEWLLTGNGEMMKKKHLVAKPDIANEDSEPYKNGLSKIPYVSVGAIAGFGNSDFSIAEQDVKDYYVIPKFKDRKIDFMIEVSGSSMYPKYNSGDVVACRIINESNFIQWNKVHVIATTEQGILIKRLRKSTISGCLLAISDNKDYEPFDIPESEITGIAIVVGVVRLE